LVKAELAFDHPERVLDLAGCWLWRASIRRKPFFNQLGFAQRLSLQDAAPGKSNPEYN